MSYYNPKSPVNPVFTNALKNTVGNRAVDIMREQRLRLINKNQLISNKLEEVQKAGLDSYNIITKSLADSNITEKQVFNKVKFFTDLKTNASKELVQTDTMTEEEIIKANNVYYESDRALKGLIPYIQAREASLADYIKTIGSNPENVGKQGYASMTDNPEFQIGTWIDSGFLEGSKEVVYDEKKGWGTKYTESPDVTPTGMYADYDGKEFVIWGSQAANYEVAIIPEVDKAIGSILEKNKIIVKGKLGENFRDIESDYTNVKINKNGNIDVTTIGANWDNIAKSIDKSMNDLAQSYLRNPQEARSVWENVLLLDGKMEVAKGGGFTIENQNKFTEELKKRAGLFIPDVDYIVGESEIGRKWIASNPEKFTTNKFSKITTDSDDQTTGGYTQDRINELINLNVPPSGTQRESASPSKNSKEYLEALNNNIKKLDNELGIDVIAMNKTDAIKNQQSNYDEEVANGDEEKIEKELATLNEIKKSDNSTMYIIKNGKGTKVPNYNPFDKLSNLEVLLAYGSNLTAKDKELIKNTIFENKKERKVSGNTINKNNSKYNDI